MTDDLSILLAAIEARPEELSSYGAIADLLDDCTEHALAHAYRWCMGWGKWPHKRTHYVNLTPFGPKLRKVPARFRWAWYQHENAPYAVIAGGFAPPATEHDRAHMLPCTLMRLADQRVYTSHAAAVQELAGWLDHLKNTYDPKRVM